MATPNSPNDFFQLVFDELRDKARSDSWLQTVEVGFGALTAENLLSTYIELRTYLKQKSPENLCGTLESFESQLFEILLRKGPPSALAATRRARQLVIKTEFPEINPTTDIDISRYFRSRTEKWLSSAREIYLRLSVKYPDPEARATLLRWHRTNNALFVPLFEMLKAELADRSLMVFQRTASYLLRCFATGPRGKSWSLLEPIRAALKALPSSRLEAAKTLARLRSYSQAAEWHTEEFSSVCNLLEDYLGDHLFDRKEIRLVLPKSFTDQNRAKNPVKVVTYDVAHVVFTENDLKEILINPKIQGIENVTLTYCSKYWLRTGDTDLENKISLYSARHKSPQAVIFRLIKEGQVQQASDEDILYSVYNFLARDSSYQYNVRKDIYMQSVWRRIKPGNIKPVIEDTRAWAEQLIAKDKAEKKATRQRADQAVLDQRQERQKVRQMAAEAVTRMQVEGNEKRARAEAKVVALREQEKLSRERAAERARSGKRLPISTATWTKYDGTELELVPLRDRVAALQGAPNKNLHVLFRSQLEEVVQDFVQTFIKNNNLQVQNVQKTLAILAIKSFLQGVYDSPHRSWMLSNERMKVKELGLEIKDVEPIVETCLTRLTTQAKVG